MADPTTERDALLARIDMCLARHRAYHGSGARVLVDDLRALYDRLVKAEASVAALARWQKACGPLLDYLTGSGELCEHPVDYARELQGRADALEAKVGRLVEAGEDFYICLCERQPHWSACRWNEDGEGEDGPPCDCGLHAALDAWTRAKEDPPAAEGGDK